MNTKKAIWGLMAAASVMLAGCDMSDPIYDTAHPGTGQITLTTDWSNIGAGLTSPASYTLTVDQYRVTLTGNTNTVTNLFLPGTYHADVYNTADKITVSGATATVATVTAPAGGTGTFVDNNPAWFFTWAADQTIEADRNYNITSLMKRQVYELTFTVTPTGGTADKIEAITATLGGIAGQMNMDSDVRGAASSVAMTFVKQLDGKWKATIRILGIVGASQPLATTVKFTDGTPGDVVDTTDLHDQIDDLSGGGDPELDLESKIVETPTGAGFTAEITKWTTVTGSGTAN